MWLFVIISILVQQSLEHFEVPKSESAIPRAVADIVLKSFKNDSKTIHILQASSDFQDRRRQQDTINEILCLLKSEVVVQIEESSHLNNLNSDFKTRNILICDTYESFQQILSKVDPKVFNYQGLYLIVFIKYDERNYETMAKIFHDLLQRYIINVDILWAPSENDNEAMLYTFYPYTSFYCSKSYPVKHNQFHGGNWLTTADFFPNKMKNLFGCILRAATFSNPPFIIIRQHGSLVEVDGIDGILLRVLSQKMNFNVELFTVADAWGDIYNNGTSTGELSLVERSRFLQVKHLFF